MWLKCRLGQQCVKSETGLEKCICAEKGSCTQGHSLVCGSDGNMYESHCDLHRAACVSGRRIYVDHKAEACYQKGKSINRQRYKFNTLRMIVKV